jgi:hypothetical protein
MDFNATVFNVMYPADENVPRMPAFINITDDDVNEAREQTFIVFLEVVDAVNLARITITRTNSTCVIVDNDSEYGSWF